MLDFVISGGRIVDGTGRPAYQGAVGIAGDTIVTLGAETPEARETIDAAGRVVAPGFVDIHTHSDYTLLLNRDAESSVLQGVTTELMGNCGMSCAPLRDPDHLPQIVLEYMPGADGRWRGFGEWLGALESHGLSINVASLVGHGAVRMAVLGLESRAAVPEETEAMTRLVEESIEAGAWGLSSGLEYVPGKNAQHEELVALCRAVHRKGGFYATHIRNRDYEYAAAIEEAIETAGAADVPLQISHIAPRWGARPGAAEEAFRAVDRARARGVDVAFDNHPYTRGRGLVVAALPPWALEGGTHRLRERLRDPAQRAAMRDYPQPQWKHVRERRWELLVVYDAPANRHLQGRTIAEIAEERGCDPWDVVCALILDQGDNPNALFWSAPIHDQEDVDESFRRPEGMIMSDGSAVAPRGPYRDTRHIYAYGWASHVLRVYVRERGLLTLEEAVHKMTGRPADRIGLRDRGVLAPGRKADIVIFDPDTVADRATFESPIAFPSGIDTVLVNGRPTVRGGSHTGARAGRVLRRM